MSVIVVSSNDRISIKFIGFPYPVTQWALAILEWGERHRETKLSETAEERSKVAEGGS